MNDIPESNYMSDLLNGEGDSIEVSREAVEIAENYIKKGVKSPIQLRKSIHSNPLKDEVMQAFMALKRKKAIEDMEDAKQEELECENQAYEADMARVQSMENSIKQLQKRVKALESENKDLKKDIGSLEKALESSNSAIEEIINRSKKFGAKSISPETRSKVIELFNQGYSYGEIAKATGISKGSAYNIVRKAKEAQNDTAKAP